MSASTDLSDLELGEAACRGMDPEVFFPVQQAEPVPDDVRDACVACPVRRPCLAYALTHDVVGLWAGTNTAQRAELRRRHGLAPVRRVYSDDTPSTDPFCEES